MSEWTDFERYRQSFEGRWRARYIRNAWVSGVGAAFFVAAFATEAGTGWTSGSVVAYSYGAGVGLFLCDIAYNLRKLGVPW